MVEFRLENAFSRFGLEFRIVMGTMGISNTDQILNSFRRVIRANTIETKRQTGTGKVCLLGIEK